MGAIPVSLCSMDGICQTSYRTRYQVPGTRCTSRCTSWCTDRYREVCVTYIVYDINIDSGSRRTVWRKLVHISFGLKINYDVDPDPLGTVPATLLDSVIRNSGCW